MHYSQLPPDPQNGMLRPAGPFPCGMEPCRPCGCFPPAGPPCPMPAPVPTACTSALYNQSTEEITVNDEAALPLTNVVTIGSDLTYDVNTGFLTVNRPGVYLFHWNLLVEPAATDANAPLVFALESTAGQVYALSAGTYITAEEAPAAVTGTAVRQLPAGTNLGLFNRSGAAVRLAPVTSAGLAFAGSLTVVKIC